MWTESRISELVPEASRRSFLELKRTKHHDYTPECQWEFWLLNNYLRQGKKDFILHHLRVNILALKQFTHERDRQFTFRLELHCQDTNHVRKFARSTK